jgi:acetyl esterase/lipase
MLLTRNDIPMLPSDPPAARIAYGIDPNQFADLRLPTGSGPFPVVAVFHGGCWAEFADVAYTAPLASALTRHGWATWNVEYRRSHQPGGGWPGTFDDAALGLDALREAARSHPLDLSRVVAIGHSAGGQLALWCAVGATQRIRGAVSIGGIPDLAAFAASPSSCEDRVMHVMGGSPSEVPERYARVSPSERLPLQVPQVMIWGELDAVAPFRIFAPYEAKALAAGDTITSRVIPGAGHHELMSPQLEAYRALVEHLTRFLG